MNLANNEEVNYDGFGDLVPTELTDEVKRDIMNSSIMKKLGYVNELHGEEMLKDVIKLKTGKLSLKFKEMTDVKLSNLLIVGPDASFESENVNFISLD